MADNQTTKQVSLYLKAMTLDLQSPNPFKTLEEKQAIIEKYTREIAELESGTCEMDELVRYDGMDPHYRCLSCGHENYENEIPTFCPRCGKVVMR